MTAPSHTLAAAGKASETVVKDKILPPSINKAELAKLLGYRENAGAPSAVTPRFIGEVVFDTTNEDFYDAYAVTSGAYNLRGTSGLTVAEMAVLDGAVAGTVTASKAVVANAQSNIGIVKATQLHIGTSGAEVQVTATPAQLNTAAVTTAGVAEASKLLLLGATKNVDTIDVAQAGLKADGVVVGAFKYVDVAATAALLDAAGTVNVIAGVAGDQYKVRDIRLVGGGTNFGAGGDRLLSLTDGTTVYTTIANADLETAPAATLEWGNVKVPFLTGTSDTATVSGQALRFAYSGGTTDHTTGSIKFSVLLEKVA